MQRVHSSWFRSGRWAMGGILAATAMLASCGTEDATDDLAEPTTPAAPSESQAAGAVKVADRVVPPRITNLVAIPQGAIGVRAASLVEATLAPSSTQVSEVTVDGDDGRTATLRDDGSNGDRIAGDGVFSGPAVLDLAAEQAHNRAVASATSSASLPDPTFNGRQLVSTRDLRPQPDSTFAPFARIPLRPIGISTAILPANSLLIRHPGVINDPTRTFDPCTNAGNPAGVWTFNHLMTEMANQPLTGVTPAAFTRNWLRHWEVPQPINGWVVPARPAILPRIINPWPLIGTQLNMARSPFKLIAIVNRLDLGAGSAPAGYGGSGGGELRFVFAAVDRSAGCNISPFLVIFEYEVPKSRCPDVKAWAQAWANLSLMAIGSAAYNAALQALTQQVVVRNTMPAKPNGNAINQIRTNEIMLAAPWELREFRFLPTTVPLLGQTTMALTPGDPRNNTAVFANFVNANTPAILANTYTVPPMWLALPFLGANSLIPNPFTMFWNGPGIVDLNARHKFSQNTCNGCHAREMNTTFTHIDEFGNLSPLLSGPLVVIDPVSGVPRNFDEMLMRQTHLNSVANQSCLTRAMDSTFALSH
jgi:hypothetical protein